MSSMKANVLGALCISTSSAVALGDAYKDSIFNSYIDVFFDPSEFRNFYSPLAFDWDPHSFSVSYEESLVNDYLKPRRKSDFDFNSWNSNWYAVKEPEPEPVQEPVAEPELKWRKRTGRYEFPGRTDWGEDPDHFGFNKGGLASHNRFNKSLDYSEVIRPNEPKEEAKQSHYEQAKREPLTIDSEELRRDRDARYADNVRQGSHRNEPIPDAVDYSDLNDALGDFKADHPHEHYDAPELKVRRNPHTEFSYLKSADDFGDEECVDCDESESHPLDKPGDEARREAQIEKSDYRRAKSHRQDPIPEDPAIAGFFMDGNTNINDYYNELPRTYEEFVP